MDYITHTFKTQYVYENAHDVPWHPKLIELIFWIHTVTAYDLFFTSARRPGDPGVHGTDPLRGIDLRGKGKPAQKLVDFINQYWEYDSSRPKYKIAILHNVGRGEHIHLQVHDKTIIKRGGWQTAW